VLVGVGSVVPRASEPGAAPEAVALMVDASRAALADAGGTLASAAIDWIGVPDGTWGYTDPGRLVGVALGSPTAHTVLADVGITQQELVSMALTAVAAGDAEVAIVVGAEARWREQQARRAGLDAPETTQGGVLPDVHVQPHSLGIDDLEIERNIVNPVISYALIDRALAAQRGWSAGSHRDRLAQLWARFGEVAASNPDAWDRTAPDVRAIREAGEGNRLLAFPYTKRMASQWNVDQGAAMVVCSLDTARRFGVPDDRIVHPWSSTICNHAVPVAGRPELHRSPGAAAAAARLFELSGVPGVSAVDHIDLYSCFPAAVQVYASELGMALEPPFDDPPTVTGGMSFAGGPLNNYVLQAMVRLIGRLRDEPGSLGLSSSVSGFLTKQGFSLWSTSPPPAGAFSAADVTDEVAATDVQQPVSAVGAPAAAVVAATVDRTGFEPRVVAVCERADGSRTIGASTDPGAVADLEAGSAAFEPGAAVEVADDGTLERRG
jgi:acetyl-CoA C-acetyltransferase